MYEERRKIALYLRGKWGIRRIARMLGRSHAVVSREVRRNTSRGKRYDPDHAERLAKERKRRNAKARKLDQDDRLKRYVETRLKDGWNPKVIAGRLKDRPPPAMGGRTVSHEAIYRYIYDGNGRWAGWWRLLPSGRMKRRKRRARKTRDPSIQGRISVHLRPESAEQRLEVGHWESDSVLYREQRSGLSVQSERRTRLARFHRICDKSAGVTLDTLAGTIETLPADAWKSITFDNGGEGARHLELRTAYGIDTYFCDPYASWQKGGVENLNRIIRRYLPFETDLSTVTDGEILAIQERINDTPRAILGYRTPNEAMAEYLREVVH